MLLHADDLDLEVVRTGSRTEGSRFACASWPAAIGLLVAGVVGLVASKSGQRSPPDHHWPLPRSMWLLEHPSGRFRLYTDRCGSEVAGVLVFFDAESGSYHVQRKSDSVIDRFVESLTGPVEEPPLAEELYESIECVPSDGADIWRLLRREDRDR